MKHAVYKTKGERKVNKLQQNILVTGMDLWSFLA